MEAEAPDWLPSGQSDERTVLLDHRVRSRSRQEVEIQGPPDHPILDKRGVGRRRSDK